jgi:aspartate aminotransferase
MPNAGFEDVRGSIALHLQKEHSLEGCEARHVLMSVGAGGALNVILKTILNPGDEVVILAPFFVEYIFYTQNHQGNVVIAETTEQFDLDFEELDKKFTGKTKAIIINSPNNPTGKLYSDVSLNNLAQFLDEKQKQYGHPIYLISDEPYREIVFDGKKAPPVVSKHENSILAYSWSKSLSIPGDRIGFIGVNPALQDVNRVLDGLTFSLRILGFVNAPATMQRVVKNLIGVTVDAGQYEAKRDRIYEALTTAGYDVYKPEGTFYIFPKSLDEDDEAFTRRALKELVLVVPGKGFGRAGYVRIAFCTDDRTIDGALEKLIKLAR